MTVSSIVLSLFGCGEMAKPRKRADSGESMSQSVRDAVRDADGSRLDELDFSYTDRKHRFSFKYSGDWMTKESDKDLRVYLPNDEGKTGGGVIAIEVYPHAPNLMKETKEDMENVHKEVDPDYSIIKFEKIKFDGEDCLYYMASLTTHEIHCTETRYCFNYKNQCFVLTFRVYQGYEVKYTPYFDAVLKSFKK